MNALSHFEEHYCQCSSALVSMVFLPLIQNKQTLPLLDDLIINLLQTTLHNFSIRGDCMFTECYQRTAQNHVQCIAFVIIDFEIMKIHNSVKLQVSLIAEKSKKEGGTRVFHACYIVYIPLYF